MCGDNPALSRKVKIYLCKRYTGKRLSEIGSHFNIGESGVSKVSHRMKKIIEEDKKLKRKIEKIIKKLKLSKVQPDPF